MSGASDTAFLPCSDAREEILRQVHLLYREYEEVSEGDIPPTSRLAIRQRHCRDVSTMRGEV